MPCLHARVRSSLEAIPANIQTPTFSITTAHIRARARACVQESDTGCGLDALAAPLPTPLLAPPLPVIDSRQGATKRTTEFDLTGNRVVRRILADDGGVVYPDGVCELCVCALHVCVCVYCLLL